MNILGLNTISFLCSLDISSVIEVFNYKHVRDVIVFHCFKENQLILPQRMFHFNNFRTVFVFISNNISWELPNSYSKIGVLINTSCDGWEMFQEFQNSHTWVYYTDNLTSTITALSTFPIEINSDVTVVYKENSAYQVFDTYNTGRKNNGVFNVNYIGHINPGLQTNLKFITRNLNGVTLKSTVVILKKVQYESFEEYLRKTKQTGLDSVHKHKFFQLLQYISEMYNIT